MAEKENIQDALLKIRKSEPDFYKALEETILHLSATYDDKYAGSPIKTKGIMYSDSYGKGYNVGNATKYIQRYLTEGFSKSDNPTDLKKSIHYLLFELTRLVMKNKQGKDVIE